MVKLGRRIWLMALSLQGTKTNDEWCLFLVDVARSMEMEPVSDAVMWTYPTPGGAGGNGSTIVQPITDSFLAIDTWPDHNGVYLFVNSCKKFDEEKLIRWIESRELIIIDNICDSIGLKGHVEISK